MIRGSCLCGGVRYTIAGAVTGPLSHCHCAMCRKAHGAAFASYLRVDAVQFAFVAGAELVREFRSSDIARRTFCAVCGSTLQFLEPLQPEAVWIAAGTLDEDPGVRPSYHLFTGSKAAWFEISDALPRYETFAPPG